MKTTVKRVWRKFERPFWTFLQAGLATVAVPTVGLPVWAIPAVAYALAEVKRFVKARREAAES